MRPLAGSFFAPLLGAIAARCTVVGCVSLALGSSAASATSLVLDQDYVVSQVYGAAGVFDQQSIAQTFTVGISGQLGRIELQIGRAPIVTDDLQVEIRRTTPSGEPDLSVAALLATFDVASSAVPVQNFPSTLVGVDLGPATFPVVAGDVLSILLRADTPQLDWYLWVFANPSSYAGGSMYVLHPAPVVQPTSDAGFRTFVTIPEPATGLLVMVGLVGLAGWRKRRV